MSFASDTAQRDRAGYMNFVCNRIEFGSLKQVRGEPGERSEMEGSGRRYIARVAVFLALDDTPWLTGERLSELGGYRLFLSALRAIMSASPDKEEKRKPSQSH
jgi:hypothetical protein